MTWFQRVVWVPLVGMAGFAIVLLAGRDLDLGSDDIIVPAFAVMGVVGAWLSQRRPANPIGWLFLAAGTASALISRTLSYLIVSLLAAGTYALVVTSVTTLVPDSSALAVAGATLAAAAVFRPVLRRVRSAVDHRFNRARFDAVHEIDEFAARLRDSVNPDAAAQDPSEVVRRTLQPTAVGVWTTGVDR